ncbi:MAG: ribonuclease D [Candidatus Azotimanducaceae bacterium WSBS_2022_MAG_OTU7]
MAPEYRYIDTDEQLLEVVAACLDVSVIALDTEFVRTNTYYPIVGLIQIYTGAECFLIDPLSVSSIEPLKAVIEAASLLKVLHACSEDMEVFQHAIGVVPAPVYDTQIASAALGVGFSVGYQALVEHYLDISLSKDQTRSDWLARPLTTSQLDYAALDVIHLLEVYKVQLEELEGGSKLDWVEAESLGLGQGIPTVAAPEESYKKLKGLWQLDRKQLNLLKTLCTWREITARKEDLPRNRVVDQKSLISIVKEAITGKQAFQSQAGLNSRQVRKYGDEIQVLQAEAKLVLEEDCPDIVIRTDAPINNKKLKRLKQVVEERARRLNVAPELLTKRRYLEKLIRSEDERGQYHLPGELGGWREAAIGEALLAELAEPKS